MPVVPAPETQTVLPGTGPATPYQTAAGATPDAFGANVGAAVQGLGREVERSGDMMARHAIQFQMQQNEASTNEALTNYDIQSAQVYNEFKNLQGNIPQERMSEYMQRLESLRGEMRGALPNAEVQRQFDQGSRRQFGYTVKEMAGHAATENKKYQIATSNGRINAAAASAATLNAGDDNLFQTKYDEARKVAEEAQDVKGFEGPAREAAILNKLSPMWERRLKALADTDPQRARKLFDSNKDKLAPDQIAPVEHTINQQLLDAESKALSERVVNGGGNFESLLRKRESSNDPRRQNDLGYTGLYQFGAPRLADLGVYRKGEGETFGRTWGGSKWSGTFEIPGFPEVKTIEDFRNNPAAQKKAFDLHVAKMDEEIADKGLDQYIGKTINGVGITRAGLYNMIHLGGVGGAKEALEGKSNRADAFGTTVMDYAKMGEGVGGGLTVDAGPAQLQSMVDAAKAGAAGANVPEELRPRLEELATQRVRNQYSNVKAIARDAQNSNWNQAQLLVMGGMNGPKNLDEFYAADPKAKELFQSLDGSKQRAIEKVIASNAKADYPHTAESEARFFELRGQAMSSDPKAREEFASADIANEEMPRSRRSALLKMQQGMKQDEEGRTHLAQSLGVVRSSLAAANLSSSGNKKKYDEFVGRFNDQLQLFQQENKGRRPTEDETRKIAAGLVREVVTTPGMIWDSKAKLFEAPVPDEFSKKFAERFPGAAADQIRRAYQRFRLYQ
jgi:hypothetical protein